MVRGLGLLALMASGCTAGAEDPRLIAITPPEVTTRAATAAVVTGANLRAQLRLDLDSDAPAAVDAGWVVWIADAVMPDTRWRDRTALDVMLPRGLPVGVHDVRAIAPDGSVLVLAEALEVTAGDDAVLDASSDGPRDATSDAMPDAVPDATPDAMGADEPRVVAIDPLGDGTEVAYVTSYRGRVVVGPNARGTGLVDLQPDGTGLETRTFAFARDVTGPNTHDNTATTYRSIGAAGCTPNTSECGPNNENLPGLLAGVTIEGTEWLVLVGGHTAKGLEYVYLSAETGDTLGFRYVDLRASTAADAFTGTAVHVDGDRLHVGMLGEASAGPMLVALTRTPPSPGLDAMADEAINLKFAQSPMRAAGGMTEKIDALAIFGDRLYAANPQGWMRAVSSPPGEYGLLGGLLTWNSVEPSASELTTTTAVTTPKLGGFVPADRAVPQMATWAGRFYVARNTTSGPQLWVCTPALLTPTDCFSADFALLAPSAASPRHTQLGGAFLPAISLVAATATHLYVGFDGPGGVEVYRTAATTPSRADFERVGTPGLGVPTATQIMDGERLVFAGHDAIWLTIGRPGTPVALVVLP